MKFNACIHTPIFIYSQRVSLFCIPSKLSNDKVWNEGLKERLTKKNFCMILSRKSTGSAALFALRSQLLGNMSELARGLSRKQRKERSPRERKSRASWGLGSKSLSVRIAVAFAQSACGATAAVAAAHIIFAVCVRGWPSFPLASLLPHLAGQSLSLRRNQSADCQGASQIMQIRLGERGHPAKLN